MTERLGKEKIYPIIEGRPFLVEIRTDDENGQVRELSPRFLRQLSATHHWHSEIGNHQGKIGIAFEAVQSLKPIHSFNNDVSLLLKDTSDEQSNAPLILDH